MTFAVFILIQKISLKNSALLTKMAALTFGVFLCHFVFVQLAYDLIYPLSALPALVKFFNGSIYIWHFLVYYLVAEPK
ncbi:hypothetical protein AHMF7605_07850 [Adhaeribacter arboris]|uniref:Uncharacterized protein n=1 Tax=Adhaeribacter arboris TaxID=2072846 RepID=A0A2T2YD70_9BACT|nr:hypothetical protein AHMF7605_07850 [Adhaeribacter arboris]